MTTITIGHTADGTKAELQLSKANRHGLVTGSTGSGKTVTLQKLAEQFSAAGVPVFMADIKGDLSGISSRLIGASESNFHCPTSFWDLYGDHGMRIRTSVQEFGADLLAEMLGLNAAQSGALAICFKKAEEDRTFLLTLDDLRWTLQDMSDNRDEVSAKYGNVTAVSLSAIRRAIFVLESQGGSNLFGEPPFDIADFMRINSDGQGLVNLLHADQLIESPRLYSIFLLWLMRELFRRLPEAGDLERPRMVFFFDEAHLLFRDAPKQLLQEIERLVRLIRSKGVGVFFVTQSPADIPDAVLAQLGNRIQHCLRAYTQRDQKMVRAAAQAFRQDRSLDVRAAVTELGIGEAIVSVLDPQGVPTYAARVMVELPRTHIGPISKIERAAIRDRDTLKQKYAATESNERQYALFMNRMLLSLGLDTIPVKEEDWRGGDSLAFVPSGRTQTMDSIPSRVFYLRKIAVGISITVAAIFFLSSIV